MQDDSNKRQVALIILDGWGYRESRNNNAIAAAKKPFFHMMWNYFPHALLKASGEAVGLPAGQMGNSEVGHMTIGAGRPIDTDLVRIGKAIKDGEFDTNPAFQKLFEHAKNNNSTLHVMGLIGPGGVHASGEHLVAFLEAAKRAGISKIAIHAFTDGRDTPPQSAAEYLKELETAIGRIGAGYISTIIGRYYAMDRDSNWDRLAKAEEAIFEGKGEVCDSVIPSVCIGDLYKNEVLDEHLTPHLIKDSEGNVWTVKQNDAVLFFNFRADRARMLSKKIIERAQGLNLLFATMTEYDKTFNCLVAFPPFEVKATLAEEISKAGLSQAHIAETEKFAHATYFLNGGKEIKYEGEDDIMIPSRKDVATHDLAPEMRANEIGEEALKQIQAGKDFIFINYANADMVGHTANVPAIIKAIWAVDRSLEKVVLELNRRGGVALVTADHGNAETNIDPRSGVKHTSHTSNPVPAIITDQSMSLREDGGLADITPTILRLFGIPQPDAMTGKSLI